MEKNEKRLPKNGSLDVLEIQAVFLWIITSVNLSKIKEIFVPTEMRLV